MSTQNTQHFSSDSSPLFSSQASTTFTTPLPTSSFFTSTSTSASTPSSSLSSSSSSPVSTSAFPTGVVAAQAQAVCIGHGIDTSATGLIAAVILPSVIGLILWILFAIIRPRFRQLYGVREWFVQQDLRPRPLRQTLWAFLFPHVPLVPSTPDDVSDAGRSPQEDAHLFPSDEQLSQRTLWIALLLVLGWSILGLAGALPLYIVSIPCLANMPSTAQYSGAYSTLQDLSLLRLLRLWDSGNATVSSYRVYQSRALIQDGDPLPNIRIRVIILTVFAIVLAVFPALLKIIKEFNRLVAYRQRWIQFRCDGKEMGWLSVRKTPGFAGWGEKRLKDFLLKTGLSSSLESNVARAGSRRRLDQSRRPQNGNSARSSDDGPNPEVDIQSLFSIVDTHHLALLIDERDEILENLEIAETRYISSFRLSTPDPSIADLHPPEPEPDRPYISRPRALGRPANRRGRRALNPAYAASSLAPTSFVAPSQYYKLRNVQGVSGGRFVENPSLSDSIHSRIVGSRFQEVNRNSVSHLPIGSLIAEKSSRPATQIPDVRRYGPNHEVDLGIDEFGARFPDYTLREEENELLGDEWVDLSGHTPTEFESDFNGTPPTGPSVRRRPKKEEQVSPAQRETFPSRRNDASAETDLPPPHLRLQPQGPFVRPLSGLNHDDLGAVYNDISQWRSKLKVINAEITEAQRESYSDIADGTNIKGWLLVGRGLRFIPGVKLIEGRAKEDIRWDVLQNERTVWDSIFLWTVVVFVTVLLAAGLTAAIGLALSTAPNVAHTLTFLHPLTTHDNLVSGLATILAPAAAAVLFITIAVSLINWAGDVRGSVSISGGHLVVFKTMFFILAIITAIGLVIVGALIFAIQSFSTVDQPEAEVANGAIYISALALSIVVTIAIISPALLMLQPFRLMHILRAERHAITPRQRFRAIYPRAYNPSFATGACILAVIFASTFSLIFPLISPPVVILLFLTLIAHRYLIGYVYARTHSQTGGLLQIWFLRRLGTLLSLQPILLGLILLSRKFWIEGGVLVGTGVLVIVFVECYTHWKTRLPGRDSLSAITRNSLDTFSAAAKHAKSRGYDDETTSLVSSAKGARARGSMASVLEMMSVTLAVMPAPSPHRGPIPLQTETLDDLTATERAARTHPEAPPHLPPLAFTDHAEDMAGILYAPELIAPAPIIWLPNDSAGVARSEAYDLQKYHDLRVTLDVRTKEDVAAPEQHQQQRTSSSRDHA